jgi:hypothetical protein
MPEAKLPSVEIPLGFCGCGCGQETKIARKSDSRSGEARGRPRRFLKGHHFRLTGSGSAGAGLPMLAPGQKTCGCGCGSDLAGRAITTAFVNDYHGLEAALVAEGHAGLPARTCQCGCGRSVGLGRLWRKGHGTRMSGADYIVDPSSGCWIWQRSIGANGYPGPARNADGKQVRAYRMIYERDRGPIPVGKHLHHVCHNPACVNPDHLEPVTPARHQELHGHKRWSPAMLSEAHQLISAGLSQRKTAARLGVSRSTLRRHLGLR